VEVGIYIGRLSNRGSAGIWERGWKTKILWVETLIQLKPHKMLKFR
jgi:hypothetical protein